MALSRSTRTRKVNLPYTPTNTTADTSNTAIHGSTPVTSNKSFLEKSANHYTSSTVIDITKANYHLKREKAMKNKFDACNRQSPIDIVYKDGGIRVFCQSGMYMMICDQLRILYRQNGKKPAQISEVKDKSGNVVTETYRVKQGRKVIYTVNLYHTQSSILTNGIMEDTFVDDDLAKITDKLTNPGCDYTGLNSMIKEAIAQYYDCVTNASSPSMCVSSSACVLSPKLPSSDSSPISHVSRINTRGQASTVHESSNRSEASNMSESPSLTSTRACVTRESSNRSGSSNEGESPSLTSTRVCVTRESSNRSESLNEGESPSLTLSRIPRMSSKVSMSSLKSPPPAASLITRAPSSAHMLSLKSPSSVPSLKQRNLTMNTHLDACPVCKENVDHNSLHCDTCLENFHPNCEELDISILESFPESSKYHCKSCRSNALRVDISDSVHATGALTSAPSGTAAISKKNNKSSRKVTPPSVFGANPCKSASTQLSAYKLCQKDLEQKQRDIELQYKENQLGYTTELVSSLQQKINSTTERCNPPSVKRQLITLRDPW
jgi:hypothetical protein